MASQQLDLIGKKYGKLTVINKAEKKNGKTSWLCRCECGNTKVIRQDNLRDKNKPTRSCGCIGTNSKDLSGQEFGKLTVMADSGDRDAGGKVFWECQCDCGNATLVNTSNLKSGAIQSCGCLSSKNKDLRNMKFGKLTVLSMFGTGKHRQKTWLCKCECGRLKVASTNHLTMGNVSSCGCLSNKYTTLVGGRFGRLTVIEKKKKRNSTSSFYICKCDCGSLTKTESSNLLSGKTRSCGCAKINPNLSDEDRLRKHRYVLSGESAVKWRKKVFVRDDYTCQLCKLRNGNGKKIVLNAHHLDGWNWCKEKRFDLKNGITLCKDCHDAFHKEYGSGNNTKEQFEAFINNKPTLV